MANHSLSTFIRHLRRVLDVDSSGTPTDAQLVERYLDTRDELAFELLVWRHGGMVLDLCRRILSQRADAEDAFQATFLTLVRKIHTIGKHGSVGSWLYKVAYRIAMEAKVRSMRRTVVERRARVRPPPLPEDEAAQREVRPILEEEISRLPERYRAPFVLCCLEGRSLEEAARQLGSPPATVGTWVSRARQKLRDRLVRRGVVLSAGTVAALSGPGPASAAPPATLVEPILRAALVLSQQGAIAPGTLPASVLALADAVSGPSRPWTYWLLATLLLSGAGAGALGAVHYKQEIPASPPSFALPLSPVVDTPGTPHGWVAWSDQLPHFKVGRDASIVHGGRVSGYVELDDTANTAKAVLRQAVRADSFRGQRVRLRGWLRTGGEGRSGLFLRVDGVDLTLGLANMDDCPLVGATDWQPFAVVLDVSAEATEITFGLWRNGPGRTWADDFMLDTVRRDIVTTNCLAEPCPITRTSRDLPACAVNLDFEDLRTCLLEEHSAAPWLGLLSRETGSGPELLVTYRDGSRKKYTAQADAVLLSYQPDRECGDFRTLAVSLADTNRTLVRFSPSSASHVVKAELVMQCDPSPYRPREPFTLAVHELCQDWQEEEVTWHTQPTFVETSGATALMPPDASALRIDVTPLVRNEVSRAPKGHGWLLKVQTPQTDQRPTPFLSGEDTGLASVLPWETSVAAARRKARDEGKLMLAYIRWGRWQPDTALREQILLGTALSDPEVLTLVGSRFVPVRIRVRDGKSEAGRQTLRELRLIPETDAGMALVIGNPEGEILASLTDMENLHRDHVLQFLLGVLHSKPYPATDDPWPLLAAGCLEGASRAFLLKEWHEKALGLSRIASLRGEYERALWLAAPVAESDGRFRTSARYECAVARMRLGRFEQATRDFQAVAAESGKSHAADAAYYLGCLLYKAEKIDEAREVWQSLVVDHPKSPAAARARLRLIRPGLMARQESLTMPPIQARQGATRATDGKPSC